MTGGNLIVLAAGGTGGHVFPAQALAEELLRRHHRLALVTDRRGAGFGGALETVTTYRISAERIDRGLLRRLIGYARLALGFFEAFRLLRRLAPAAVVGFGGYPSVPTMLAATRLRLPTLIHEQNAVLGRANRLVQGRVSGIATSFETVAGIAHADPSRIALTGNPVRRDIADVREKAFPRLTGDAAAVELLVTGGSQGATVLSDVVPEAIALLPANVVARLSITQQCRAEDLDRVRAAYAAIGCHAELHSFIEDMPARLARAHLVICRAGASTVAELTNAGRPSIMIPYPLATDAHQLANARAVERAGGAWVLEQKDLTPRVLADKLAELIGAPAALALAAAAARRAGRPDAAARLADAVERMIAGSARSAVQPGRASA